MWTAETKAVRGSEDARNPFFSHDGQWLGFSAGNKLKKVSIGGGKIPGQQLRQTVRGDSFRIRRNSGVNRLLIG
jgi:hypothetical protein